MVTEVAVDTDGRNAVIGMEQCGWLVVGYEDPSTDQHVKQNVVIKYYEPDGDLYLAGPYSLSQQESDHGPSYHRDASLAVSSLGYSRVAWSVQCVDCQFDYALTLLQQSFDYGTIPAQQDAPDDAGPGTTCRQDPSVGRSDLMSGRTAWSDLTTCDAEGYEPLGLVEGPSFTSTTSIRDCDCEGMPGGTRCRIQWQPALAMEPHTGYFAVAWADAESNVADAKFNIALRVYDPAGDMVADLSGGAGEWVNDPELEDDPDPEIHWSQTSPAVSFIGEDIVVCWIGPGLYGCPDHSSLHIWARRFKFDAEAQEPLRDPDGTPGEGRAGMFVVDTETTDLLDRDNAHPTVALREYDPASSERHPYWGSFIVAWTAGGSVLAGHAEVRAQYFTYWGHPWGTEFRVNVAGDEYDYALLAKSGQHTLVYGAQGQAAAAWTLKQGNDMSAWMTILPPAYENGLPDQCCPSDINGDGDRNGLDIQLFVNLLLDPDAQTCMNSVDLCPADSDLDDDIDCDDIPGFVHNLLYHPTCARGSGPTFEDCNENGVLDANDIADSTSEDCNQNGIPDECDIASETSVDSDEDGVPDECEPDCQNNGRPDDADVACGGGNSCGGIPGSYDRNSNGIPDECERDCNANGIPDDVDIAQNTSLDCNLNGTPDECEIDCNSNGVPDDCDIDPTDPDGDTVVWADCNANHLPDTCDLGLPPPRGSTDCNGNDIPDECDIANCPSNDPSCQDCNANGIPDSCDIAAQVSLDEDENGIPDECEEGGRTGGETGQEPPFGGDPQALEEAWEACWDWAIEQDWGPNSEYTGAEQYQRLVDKLEELGLPLSILAP